MRKWMPPGRRYEDLFEEVVKIRPDIGPAICARLLKNNIDLSKRFKSGEGKILCSRLTKDGLLSLLNRLMKEQKWKLRTRGSTQCRFIRWCYNQSKVKQESAQPATQSPQGTVVSAPEVKRPSKAVLEQLRELRELKVILGLSPSQVEMALTEIYK